MKKSFNLLIGILLAANLFGQVAKQAEDISPLLIGETMPNDTLLDLTGKPVYLQELLAKKPTVLVFYRGGWCPYCNAHLVSLAKSEAEILKLGYQIIAISPDDYPNLQPTVADDGVNYQVYSDMGGSLLKKVGIAFQAPERAKEYIAQKTKGTPTEILPVPTLMVINTDGKIVFEYINKDYSTRMSEKLLLAVLNNLELK